MPQRAMGGAQKIALRGIFAELPNHDAAQVLLGRVADLVAHGNRIIVSPEAGPIVKPRSLGPRIAMERP